MNLSTTAPNSDPIEELLSKLVDGELLESEQNDLRGELQTDVDLQQRYADLMQLHALLHWQQSETFPGLDQDSVKQVDVDDKVEHELEDSWRAIAWHYIAHPMALSMLVSALFITSIVLSLALWTVPMWEPKPDERPTLTSGDFVARIIRTHEAEWSAASEIEPNRQFSLERDRLFELTAGLAEVKFDDGATVLLEAPCSFKLIDRGSMRLVGGKLSATVPSRAIGFTIHTKLADFIDLGTEFGVQVANSGATSTHVFEGSVQVMLPRAEDQHILNAGDVILINSAGQVIDSNSVAKPRFVTAIPVPKLPVPQPAWKTNFDSEEGLELAGEAKIANGMLLLAGNDGQAILRDKRPGTTLAQAYTVAVWFKPTEIREQNILVRTDSAGASVNFSHQLLMTSEGRLTHYTFDGQSRTVSNSEPLQTGRWYHIAITAQAGGPMVLYIDGAKASEWVGNLAPFWAEGDRFHIGGRSGSISEGRKVSLAGTQGQFREVQVFGRLLRSSEVRALWEQSGASQTSAANGID